MKCPRLLRGTNKSKGVDKAVDLVAGHDEEPLDQADARRIRNKVDCVVLPLLFAVYIRMYLLTNTSLGASLTRQLLTRYVSKYNTWTSEWCQ